MTEAAISAIIDVMRGRSPRSFQFYFRGLGDDGAFIVTLLLDNGIKDMTFLVAGTTFRSVDDLGAYLARITGDTIAELRGNDANGTPRQVSWRAPA